MKDDVKHPMTAEGYAHLKEELERIKTVERPAVVRAIVEARAHGDLSENAEYHAAREKQSFIEGRVRDLEAKLSKAEVIDIATLSGDKVTFGATVTVAEVAAGGKGEGRRMTYQIVGADEADVNKGRLSVSAPLARALIGCRVGERVEVATPRGRRAYSILSLRFGAVATDSG